MQDELNLEALQAEAKFQSGNIQEAKVLYKTLAGGIFQFLIQPRKFSCTSADFDQLNFFCIEMTKLSPGFAYLALFNANFKI